MLIRKVGLLWLILTVVNYVRIESWINDFTATDDLTVWGPLAKLYSVDNYGTISLVQGVIAVVVILISMVPLVLAMRSGNSAAQPGVPAGATGPVADPGAMPGDPIAPGGQQPQVAPQDPNSPTVQ